MIHLGKSRPSSRLRRGLGRAVGLSWLLLLAPGYSLGKATLRGDWIVIEGRGNTPETVARDLGRPDLFRYDPFLGTAVSARNLRVAGEFRIGDEQAWDGLLRYSTVLEMDVAQCGRARIEVVRTPEQVGELRLERGKIATVHDVKGKDNCATANQLDVAGRLVMRHSAITGNVDGQFRQGAEVDMAHSSLTITQSTGLALDGVQAPHVRVRHSEFLDNSLYGLSVAQGKGCLEFHRTVFRGLVADIFNRGQADVALIDCDFKTIRFAASTGSVACRWTVTWRLPKPHLRVVAESEPGAGRPERVAGLADGNGICRLVLTEFVAVPGAPQRQPGVNNSTPHRITVYEGSQPLYQLANYYVIMADQEVTLPLAPARRSSE
jgi:hypothetical protein